MAFPATISNSIEAVTTEGLLELTASSILSLAAVLPLAHSVANVAKPTIGSACTTSGHSIDPHPQEQKLVALGTDIDPNPDEKEAGKINIMIIQIS